MHKEIESRIKDIEARLGFYTEECEMAIDKMKTLNVALGELLDILKKS